MVWLNGVVTLVCIIVAFFVTWFCWKQRSELRYGLAEWVTFGLFILFGCIVGLLGLAVGTETIVRLTSDTVVETVTVEDIEHTIETDSGAFLVGQILVAHSDKDEVTEVTFREYPGKVYQTEGHKDWKPGQEVQITFSVSDGEQVRYKL